MHFYQFHSLANLKINQWHIPEPPETPENLLLPEHLDLVFVPLVAFDLQAHRLGMGKGFYDQVSLLGKILILFKKMPFLIWRCL